MGSQSNRAYTYNASLSDTPPWSITHSQPFFLHKHTFAPCEASLTCHRRAGAHVTCGTCRNVYIHCLVDVPTGKRVRGFSLSILMFLSKILSSLFISYPYFNIFLIIIFLCFPPKQSCPNCQLLCMYMNFLNPPIFFTGEVREHVHTQKNNNDTRCWCSRGGGVNLILGGGGLPT